MNRPAPRLTSVALLRAGFHLATRHMEVFLLLSGLFGLLLGLASLPLLSEVQALLQLSEQELADADMATLTAVIIPYLAANLIVAPPLVVIWVRTIRLSPQLALSGGANALLQRAAGIIGQGVIAIVILFPALVPVLLLAGLFGTLFGAVGPTVSLLVMFSGTMIVVAGLGGVLAICAADRSVDEATTLARVAERARPRLGLIVSSSLIVIFLLLGLLQGLAVLLPPLEGGPLIGLLSTIIGEALRAMAFAVLIAALTAGRAVLMGEGGPPPVGPPAGSD